MTKTSQPIRADEPVLVRRNIPRSEPYPFGPGSHSHNVRRRTFRVRSSVSLLRFFQLFFLIVGLAGIGYYAYTLSDQFVYQKFENWAFDQQIGGRTGVTFAEYLREKTPFGFLVGEKAKVIGPTPLPAAPLPDAKALRPTTGSLLGRVTIGRLNLAAIVREGVDDQTLRTAVGHVPSTSLPGEPGNFAIAAHRDTLFRVLKDIKQDDLISFQSAQTTYTYRVVATKIVKPSDVSVLRPDGGGLVDLTAPRSSGPLLTMITCYPFYYVGSAPKRFIVEARLVSEKAVARPDDNGDKTAASLAVPVATQPQAHERISKRPHKRKWHPSHAAKR
jgi:sortase A